MSRLKQLAYVCHELSVYNRPGGSSLQLAIEQDLAGTLVSSHSKLYSHKNCKKIVSSDVRLKLVQGKVFIANGNLYKPHADQMGHAVGLTAAFLFPDTDPAWLCMVMGRSSTCK